jgi:hypothetical protein
MFIVIVSLSNKMIIVVKNKPKEKEYQTPRSRVDEFHLLLKISWGAQDDMSLWENVVDTEKKVRFFYCTKVEIFVRFILGRIFLLLSFRNKLNLVWK